MVPKKNEWRRRQIELPYELAKEVMLWHSGQWSNAYALGSSATAGQPVSMSMIDAALTELSRSRREIKKGKRKLGGLISRLELVRNYWREYRVESSMFDERDYGFSHEEEEEFAPPRVNR